MLPPTAERSVKTIQELVGKCYLEVTYCHGFNPVLSMYVPCWLVHCSIYLITLGIYYVYSFLGSLILFNPLWYNLLSTNPVLYCNTYAALS